jgi:hypothetical protein
MEVFKKLIWPVKIDKVNRVDETGLMIAPFHGIISNCMTIHSAPELTHIGAEEEKMVKLLLSWCLHG